jgi:hypothetical protein
VYSERGSAAARSWDDLKARAWAHSRMTVWRKHSALSLVRCVKSLVRGRLKPAYVQALRLMIIRAWGTSSIHAAWPNSTDEWLEKRIRARKEALKRGDFYFLRASENTEGAMNGTKP